MSSPESSLLYRQLPEFFYRDVEGSNFEAVETVALNTPLGEQLGLTSEWLLSEHGKSVLSGRSAIGGGSALAMT
jgi:hypothetical protein